jgi:copper resistance protein C
MRRSLLFWLLTWLLSAVIPQIALAHAVVISASPAMNSTVTGARVPIDLKFNSRIDASRSKLSLTDAHDEIRALRLKLNSPANRLQAMASNLAPGAYLLEWYVLSADGHLTRGRLKFKVAARP